MSLRLSCAVSRDKERENEPYFLDEVAIINDTIAPYIESNSTGSKIPNLTASNLPFFKNSNKRLDTVYNEEFYKWDFVSIFKCPI